MPRFPYTNFPFPYYNRRLPRFPASTHSRSFPYGFQDGSVLTSHEPVSNSGQFEKCYFDDNKNKSNNNNNDYLFDLFGLKIYTDDVLLVSLIYFLYSEGVKDEGLFIVLILLLLS